MSAGAACIVCGCDETDTINASCDAVFAEDLVFQLCVSHGTELGEVVVDPDDGYRCVEVDPERLVGPRLLLLKFDSDRLRMSLCPEGHCADEAHSEVSP